MSNLLSKAMDYFSPSYPSPAQCATAEMRSVLNAFRQTRQNDMAAIIERSSAQGARMALLQEDLTAWRQYALHLEQLALKAGLPLPPSPDE